MYLCLSDRHHNTVERKIDKKKKKKLLCGYLRIALRKILVYLQVVLSLSVTIPFFFGLTNQHENPYLLPVLELFSYFLKVNIPQLISISGNQPL